MQIFLVERTDDVGYDEFKAFVCYARNAEDAGNMLPGRFKNTWIDLTKKDRPITVTAIGFSNKVTKARVILGSFKEG